MYMLELAIHGERLVDHAQAAGQNVGADEDLGYAIHGWLRDAFGDRSPRCFRVAVRRGPTLRLWAYAADDVETLTQRASTLASPLAHAVCDWQRSASKDMDAIAWQKTQRIGFEVRLCPVGRSDEGERDAFLNRPPSSPVRTRCETYERWLASRLEPSLSIETGSVSMPSFRLVSLWRRSHRPERPGRRLVRPDTLLRGRARIVDTDAFRETLARGIGRHRAFGFGMLLVRPV